MKKAKQLSDWIKDLAANNWLKLHGLPMRRRSRRKPKGILTTYIRKTKRKYKGTIKEFILE